MGLLAAAAGRNRLRRTGRDGGLLSRPRGTSSPFWTLSHSRKISSPPLQLPELRLTLQIFSSAVFGAPAEDKGAPPHTDYPAPGRPSAPPGDRPL